MLHLLALFVTLALRSHSVAAIAPAAGIASATDRTVVAVTAIAAAASFLHLFARIIAIVVVELPATEYGCAGLHGRLLGHGRRS